MAEVGLLRFARVALGVAKAVLPDYRTEFSKHMFTQPRLLAVLCLMRYEDWTSGARLGSGWPSTASYESAVGLPKTPDHTTLYRLVRLDEQTLLGALRTRPSAGCLPQSMLGEDHQPPQR